MNCRITLLFLLALLSFLHSACGENPDAGKNQIEVLPVTRIGEELVLTFSKGLEDVRTVLKLGEKPGAEPVVTLLLGGRPMSLAPEVWDWDNKQLIFSLKRTDANREHWAKLLHGKKRERTSVAIAVTGALDRLVKPDESGVNLERSADRIYWWLAGGIVLMLVLLIVVGSWGRSLFRDVWAPGVVGKNDADKPQYSLSRLQMAFWLGIVTISYLLVWLVLGDRDSLNTTALTVLGISLGTGALAKAVDTVKPSSSLAQHPNQVEVTEVSTGNPMADVLSDGKGNISIYRVQMLVWTVILGVVFIREVLETLTMPEFSPALLGMMGISSGVYLGFKLPENREIKNP